MKKFVMRYVNTITVRIKAIWSASLSVFPVFSPNALAQRRQAVLIIFLFSLCDFACVMTLVPWYTQIIFKLNPDGFSGIFY